MKLKVQNVMDAMVILTSIINERRPMSQRGKYLVARLHAKLLPEFKVIDDRRSEIIKAYDLPQMKSETNPDTGEITLVPTDGWQVPEDKMPEFTEAWKVIADEEVDVDVQPLPFSSLSLGDDANGAIESHELITLGDLITE